MSALLFPSVSSSSSTSDASSSSSSSSLVDSDDVEEEEPMSSGASVGGDDDENDDFEEENHQQPNGSEYENDDDNEDGDELEEEETNEHEQSPRTNILSLENSSSTLPSASALADEIARTQAQLIKLTSQSANTAAIAAPSPVITLSPLKSLKNNNSLSLSLPSSASSSNSKKRKLSSASSSSSTSSNTFSSLLPFTSTPSFSPSISLSRFNDLSYLQSEIIKTQSAIENLKANFRNTELSDSVEKILKAKDPKAEAKKFVDQLESKRRKLLLNNNSGNNSVLSNGAQLGLFQANLLPSVTNEYNSLNQQQLDAQMKKLQKQIAKLNKKNSGMQIISNGNNNYNNEQQDEQSEMEESDEENEENGS